MKTKEGNLDYLKKLCLATHKGQGIGDTIYKIGDSLLYFNNHLAVLVNGPTDTLSLREVETGLEYKNCGPLGWNEFQSVPRSINYIVTILGMLASSESKPGELLVLPDSLPKAPFRALTKTIGQKWTLCDTGNMGLLLDEPLIYIGPGEILPDTSKLRVNPYYFKRLMTVVNSWTWHGPTSPLYGVGVNCKVLLMPKAR